MQEVRRVSVSVKTVKLYATSYTSSITHEWSYITNWLVAIDPNLKVLLVLLDTHSAGVVAILLKIHLELVVLLLDEVLGDIGQASKGDDSANVAHSRREVEGDLALSSKTATPVRDQVREDVGANEAA